MERELSIGQKNCLRSISNTLYHSQTIVLGREVLEEQWGLSYNEAEQVLGTVGLIAYHLLTSEQKKAMGKEKRQLAAKLIDNPPCSQQIADAENGFEYHRPSYSFTGRGRRWR